MITFRNFALGLVALAGLVATSATASANIIYSICSSGCGGTSGSYSATDSSTQAAGLTFPSPISFSAGNLNNGVYTDPTTGIIITAMNGAAVDTGAQIVGGAFKLSATGFGTGFSIQLPTNTFAFSFDFSSTSFLNGGLGIGDTNTTNLLSFGTSGFASIISNTVGSPTGLPTLFFGANSGGIISLNDFQPGDGGTGGGGDPGTTPEPSTFLLLTGGLTGLAWARRRRRPQTIPRPIRP